MIQTGSGHRRSTAALKGSSLTGAKLPLRKVKSASRQVGAAPAKPLTAAAQQLFGGRATRKGAASSPGLSLPQAGCQWHVLFRTASPLPSRSGWRRWQGTQLGPWARGTPRGSRYPEGPKARPREARPWGGVEGLSASLLPQPSSSPASAGPLSSGPNPLHPGNACLPVT